MGFEGSGEVQDGLDLWCLYPQWYLMWELVLPLGPPNRTNLAVRPAMQHEKQQLRKLSLVGKATVCTFSAPKKPFHLSTY